MSTLMSKTVSYLVIVVNLLVADAARIDWRGVGVLRVEHHRLVRWVDLL